MKNDSNQISWVGALVTVRQTWASLSGVFAATVLAATPVIVSGQSIQGVGLPPGASQSGAYGVSADGSTVAVGVDVFFNGSAYKWTSRKGLLNLGSLSGSYSSAPTGVNHNGSVLVGNSFFPDDSARAWRWSQETGLQDLGMPADGFAAFTAGVSGNGQVIAGFYFNADFALQSFVWTPRSGIQPIGFLPGGSYSSANAISDDGGTIVGQADADGGDHAFRWTPRGGMQALPFLSPDDAFANAFGVNRNGSIVAGFSDKEPVIWIRGTPKSLGRIPGDANAVAFAVNGDGSVVAGYSFQKTGVHATVWTAATGTLDLNTLLPKLGIDLTGWKLEYSRDISSDGLTIVGEGKYQGQDQGWVVKLKGGCDRNDRDRDEDDRDHSRRGR